MKPLRCLRILSQISFMMCKNGTCKSWPHKAASQLPRFSFAATAQFYSNPNWTHLNQLNKVFRINRNFQASVLRQVGSKLCRILFLQKQDWTPRTKAKPQYLHFHSHLWGLTVPPSTQLLETRCPAKFISSLLQHACPCFSSNPEHLDYTSV